MREVTADDPSAEYTLRQVFRWYSEKFHTPLDRVADLLLHDVLQHYYEAQYEDLRADDPQRFKEELEALSMTAAEYRAHQEKRARAAAADDEFFKAVSAEAKQQAAAPAPAPVAEPPQVKMQFVDLAELDRLMTADGLEASTLTGLA